MLVEEEVAESVGVDIALTYKYLRPRAVLYNHLGLFPVTGGYTTKNLQSRRARLSPTARFWTEDFRLCM